MSSADVCRPASIHPTPNFPLKSCPHAFSEGTCPALCMNTDASQVRALVIGLRVPGGPIRTKEIQSET